MSQLDELKVFIRVAESGAIVKAAEQMDIAKSAVSRRLAELEKRMGTSLINRTTRKLSLTDAGQRCYEHALRVMEAMDELNNSVAEEEQQLRGLIRMSLPSSFALNQMTEVLNKFLLAHPAINFDIDLSDSYQDIIGSGLDLAIRIGELKDSTLRAKRLSPIRTCLAASRQYLDQHGSPTHLDDLEKHQLLLYNSEPSNSLKFYNNDNKEFIVNITPKITVNNGDLLHQLALKHQGIVFTPTFISWQALKSGELVAILPDYTPQTRDAYAIYPNTRFLSKRVRVFIDFLSSEFSESPIWDEGLTI